MDSTDFCNGKVGTWASRGHAPPGAPLYPPLQCILLCWLLLQVWQPVEHTVKVIYGTRIVGRRQLTVRSINYNSLLNHSRSSSSFEITPPSRAHVRFYYISIVGLNNKCLSCTVIGIFSIEYCCELERWVRGRSRSLKMALIDKSCTNYYCSANVRIALFCCIFKLFGVE